MFVHAAQQAGYCTVVLDPDQSSPAGRVAHHHVSAAFDNSAALIDLASRCRAVTTEFENVPADALDILAAHTRVAPGAASVRVCQHRAREKAFFELAGVPCAPYAAIATESDLAGAPASLLPGLLKTASLGYDGRGQAFVQTRAQLAAAWSAVGQVECVLEQRLALALELSVVVARGFDGAVVALPVQQNLHQDGILAVTQVPAPDIAAPLAAQAVACASRLATELDHVGVLCVEFFVLADGTLLANEMAPRPHNSGHHSLDSCDLSQFELQLRALAGLPLVAPRQHSAAVMLNLLGDLWFRAGVPDGAQTPPWADVLALPGVHLHLYGKSEARPGRKMGHLTVTAANPAQARAVALQAAGLLGLSPFQALA
jgi:5-(carboxyamino)imidazole ribonucleotide synthase